MINFNKQKLAVILALTAVQVLFGINYISSKIIIGVFPPLIWAWARVFIAAILLCLIALLTRRPRPPFSLEFFGPLALYSLFGVILNQASFLTGLRHTTATNSAILNTLIPVFTLLLVTLTGKEKATPQRVIGFFFALTGVLLIRKIEAFTFSDATLIGDWLTLLNCLSYAIFLTLSKKFIRLYDPVWTTAGLFSVGSIGLGLLSIPSWSTLQWPRPTPVLVECLVFSILGGTLLAYLLNLWALRQTRSSTVALYIYLQPVVASLLAWVFFSEVMSLRTFLSSLLIFIGMIFAL